MAKVKYHFNPNSLTYEKVELSWRERIVRYFGYIAAGIMTIVLISLFAFKFIGSPNERKLRQSNAYLEDYISDVSKDIADLQQQLKVLETRDNEIYRSIFEANPIPDSIRQKKIETKQEIQKIETLRSNDKLIGSIEETILSLKARLAAQSNSYDQLKKLVADKQKLLEATPAIQPVSNKNLERIASGFGYRIDPVYKTVKKHEGIDFTAPQGAPIYATANGVVTTAGNTGNGYGNHVVIDHGYGYKTLYGHMVRIKCREGQSVKRGQVIGWVGSTGKSIGPHCHYEVHKNNTAVDPVYFFYNDLSAEQYDRILKKAAASNQSLD